MATARGTLLTAFALSGWSLPCPGQEDAPPTGTALREAVVKSVKLIEASTREYRDRRDCFSCHHQAHPTLALREAAKRGVHVDQENLEQQREWTYEHLKRGQKSYAEGKGQGGRADTAGYALWTLAVSNQKPDEVTDAVAHFLLQWSKDRAYWRCNSNRPPSEASHFTTTYVSLLGLIKFAPEKDREKLDARKASALEWLMSVEPDTTEDAVFRVRALGLVATKDQAAAEAAELLQMQRPDGGWAQTGELESDAYATATVLVALNDYAAVAPSDPAYVRGIRFLLETQLEDGSWHIKSRSRPFQTYFESGFPHGTDQFISISASSWATIALLRATDRAELGANRRERGGSRVSDGTQP